LFQVNESQDLPIGGAVVVGGSKLYPKNIAPFSNPGILMKFGYVAD
jgi:hypothetical protein